MPENDCDSVECVHEPTIMEDDTITCRKCAHVLSEHASVSFSHGDASYEYFSAGADDRYARDLENHSTYLIDVCANMNVCKSLRQSAFRYFQELSAYNKFKKGFKDRDLLIFCLYHTLQICGAGRTYDELIMYTHHFKSSVLNRIEKVLQSLGNTTLDAENMHHHNNDYTSVQLLDRFCGQMGIAYHKQKYIARVLRHIEKKLFLQVHRKELRCASAIISGVRKGMYSIAFVAKSCGVHLGTLRRILRDYRVPLRQVCEAVSCSDTIKETRHPCYGCSEKCCSGLNSQSAAVAGVVSEQRSTVASSSSSSPLRQVCTEVTAAAVNQTV